MDGYIDPWGAYLLAGVLLVAAVAAVLPIIFGLKAAASVGTRDLEITFWAGVAMVFSYSCWSFRYRVYVCVYLINCTMCMCVCFVNTRFRSHLVVLQGSERCGIPYPILWSI